MSGYTKGPWEAVRDGSHFGSLSTVIGGGKSAKWPGETLIIQVGGGCSIGEQEANTRLISAAPELLEALKAVTGLVIQHIPSAIDLYEVDTALSAIAKAEGK